MKQIIFFTKIYLLFILSAFTGWIYEITTTYLLYDRYIDRGILHLPLCPIYGFGMVLLYVLLHKTNNNFAILTLSSIITTIIELSASYIIEYKFHYILWTYEGWPFNFQNRISLISSLIFGIMALFAFKILNPAITKLVTKFNIKITIIAIVLTLIAIMVQILGMNSAVSWVI